MVSVPANRYSNVYLNGVRQALSENADGNGGKKDGMVTVQEALNSLDIGGMLYGIQQGTQEYNNLKTLADNIPQALQKYAGKDGVFQAQEWADFLNGNEWGQFLDSYSSSSKCLKQEMQKIEQSQEKTSKINENVQEAISGLMVLGYSKKDIEKAFEHLAVESLSVEDLIKKGLILLSTK